MDIQKVGVVGCGLMGSGIAEIAAKGGFDVVVREVDQDLLAAGQKRIRKSMDKAVEMLAREAFQPALQLIKLKVICNRMPAL